MPLPFHAKLQQRDGRQVAVVVDGRRGVRVQRAAQLYTPWAYDVVLDLTPEQAREAAAALLAAATASESL